MSRYTILNKDLPDTGSFKRRKGARKGPAGALVCLLILFCCSSLYAGMSPDNPGINGDTVNAAIGHGDLVYHLTSSGLVCSHEPVTVFSGGNTIYKTPSLDDKYSIVIPKGGNFAALHVDFIDNDFEVTGGVYKTAYELSSFGISGNLQGTRKQHSFGDV